MFRQRGQLDCKPIRCYLFTGKGSDMRFYQLAAYPEVISVSINTNMPLIISTEVINHFNKIEYERDTTGCRQWLSVSVNTSRFTYYCTS